MVLLCYQGAAWGRVSACGRYRRVTKLLRELFSITVGSLELASAMFPFKNDLQTFVAGVSQISPWNMIFVICLTCRAVGRAMSKSF